MKKNQKTISRQSAAKLTVLAVSCLALFGCNDISGTLTVNTGQTLQLKDKSGQTVTITEGNATVEMSSGKIQIKAMDSGNNKETVTLDAPNNLLPQFQTSGTYTFLASASGQPVNIQETTINSDTQTAEHQGWESCTQVVTVNVPCPPPSQPDPNQPAQPPSGNKPNPAPSKDPGKGDPGKGKQASRYHHGSRHLADVCTANQVVEGRQQIQFHFDGDSFEFQLIFTDPTSNTQIASFDGFSTSSDRIIDQYLSGCLIH